MPVERYSKAPEIRAHCRRIADHFGLYHDALFSTQVTALDWDADAAAWRVATDRGDRIRARFVVLATGPLNRPKLAAIPGIETFAGRAFHTSRWDYGLHRRQRHRADDRPGGQARRHHRHRRDRHPMRAATGRVCWPPLRVPAHAILGGCPQQRARPTRPGRQTCRPAGSRRAWRISPPRWPARCRTTTWWPTAGPCWRAQCASDWPPAPHPPTSWRCSPRRTRPRWCRYRARVDDIVNDPATADALKPWFSLFCKRPCFHDDYLAVFNRPNVTLVDTAGRGVERIDPGVGRSPAAANTRWIA